MDSPYRAPLLYTGLFIYSYMNLDLRIREFLYFVKYHLRGIIALATIPALTAMYELYTFATVIIISMARIATISVASHFRSEDALEITFLLSTHAIAIVLLTILFKNLAETILFSNSFISSFYLHFIEILFMIFITLLVLLCILFIRMIIEKTISLQAFKNELILWYTFGKFLFRLLIPICTYCGKQRSGWRWCQNCGKNYFQNNFQNWTSGDNEIDDLIKYYQLNAKHKVDYIEWIPYDRLKILKLIGKGGYGAVHPAVWLDGPLDMIMFGEFRSLG
ncbi:kinase-like protein [Gigaspora margarita]|uniref:Kinase-like protein n=1 Tax=Gigaspora margarita TaxID=4874 RepID=A0A8H4AFY4_GIGMA|nr:kinase-like protein [Gigaspora margarita]